MSQTNKNITAEIIDDDIHLGRFSRSNEREIVRFDWKFYNSLILSSEFCAFAGEKQNEGDEAEELFANLKKDLRFDTERHPPHPTKIPYEQQIDIHQVIKRLGIDKRLKTLMTQEMKNKCQKACVVKLLKTNEKEAMFPFADMVVFQDMN